MTPKITIHRAQVPGKSPDKVRDGTFPGAGGLRPKADGLAQGMGHERILAAPSRQWNEREDTP